MSEPDLYLEAIEIHRMPGFPPTRAFEIEDLSPGITVVHGPNASGKTTVAEAISLAVHGDASVDGRVQRQASLRGRLQTPDGLHEVRVDAGQRSFTRDGDPVTGPEMPATALADRYQLWLHELIQAEDPNRDFAEEILKASRGGYDVRQARDELGFRASPSPANISERRDYNAARDELSELAKEVIDPSETEQRLEELERERDQLQDVRQRAAALEQAKTYREHQSALEQAERRLDELPDALEDVTRDHPDRLAELRSECEEARQTIRQAEGKLEQARETLEDVDLPDEEPPEDLVPTLRKRVQGLQQTEQQIRELGKQAEKASGRAREARGALGEVTDLDALEEVDTELVQEAEQLAERAQTLQQREATLEAVEVWLESDEPPVDREDLEEGLRALRRWLQQPTTQPAEQEGGSRTVGLVASALTALAGAGALGLSVLGQATQVVAAAGAVLLLAGLVLLYLASRSSARAELPGARETRETYERDFERTGLDRPPRWEREAVEEHVDRLHETLVDVKLVDERERKRLELEPDRETLARQRAEIEEDAEDLSRRLGVELDLEERSFLWFVRNLADWQTARTEQAGAEAELEGAREQRDELAERIREELAPYDLDLGEDAEAALTAVERLEERFRTFREADAELDQTEDTLEQARADLEETEQEIEALFEELGLEPGDEAGLQRLCDRLPDYEEALDDRSEAKPLRDQALEDLRGEPGYDEAMEEMGETEIQAELDRLEGRLGRLDELQEEIPTLQERIRGAKREERIEAAIAERDQALAALEDKMEEETAQVVGWAIAEHVHELTRDRDRPPVFHRARELLTTITNGRYKLQFSDADPPEFRAMDTWHKETKTLDELSSGTRVQLLLAVRLAFVEQQEQGPKLPLILDETLANTDDTRARALIDAIVRIAREGRQIFYLTAQQDEVAKWVAALDGGNGDGDAGAGGEVDHAIVDLSETRSIEEDAPTVELASTSIGEIPRPEGREHAAYGQALDVPPYDPREDVGSAHLWYLVEDPDLLYTLLEVGIERWGELATLREETAELDAIVADDRWGKIQARAKALDAYRSAWTVGRGQPVDRAVLDDAPGVTDNKIDEVAELAEELDGEPGALLDALDRGEVAYFRANQHDKLEAYLQREGYVDERQRLSDKEIRQRVLTSVADEIQEGIVTREEVDGLLQRLGKGPG